MDSNLVSVMVIVWLLIIHWLADFVFQSDMMAKGKSKDIGVLLLHILTYITVLGFGVFTTMGITYSTLGFVVLNGVLHMLVDYVTSKVNSRLWEVGKVHNFFVMIGFDQLLHINVLIVSGYWLGLLCN